MATIKAYGVEEYGGAEALKVNILHFELNLKLLEISKPLPGDRDLLVRIKAVGVNPVSSFRAFSNQLDRL